MICSHSIWQHLIGGYKALLCASNCAYHRLEIVGHWLDVTISGTATNYKWHPSQVISLRLQLDLPLLALLSRYSSISSMEQQSLLASGTTVSHLLSLSKIDFFCLFFHLQQSTISSSKRGSGREGRGVLEVVPVRREESLPTRTSLVRRRWRGVDRRRDSCRLRPLFWSLLPAFNPWCLGGIARTWWSPRYLFYNFGCRGCLLSRSRWLRKIVHKPLPRLEF